MPLRILILTENFNPTTETFIYHDVVALQKHAIVKVGCLKRQNESIRPFNAVEVIDVEMSWLRKKWHNQLYKFNLALNFYYRPLKLHLSALLKEFRPQVIHLHFGIQALQFIDNLEFSGPIFITFHGYDATKLVKNSAVYRKRLKELFSRKNIFPLATAKSLFSYMERFDLNSKRSQVMYSGIKLDLFKLNKLSKNKDLKILTQISSFRDKKGHFFLLRAFRQLLDKRKGEDIRLILAGGGPLEIKMKFLARELDLGESVQFFGWITQEEAVKLLQQTDVFVHPSITTEDGDMESTTVAILEAMAMELPIFSTRHSGIPEVVEQCVNGLLAEERNIDDYVNCMDKLLDWGRQARNREKIVTQFNHQIHVKNLLQAYHNAIIECRLL